MNINTHTLQQLTAISAVSSDEERILRFIQAELKMKVNTTPMGDIYVGSETPRLLLTAHVDEVGVIINRIHEDGTVNILPVGLVTPKMMAGTEVVFQGSSKQAFPGIILYPHALDIEAVNSWDDLSVDIGFHSIKECQKAGVSVGMFGTYPKNWHETSQKILASSLDNRIGVWYLLEVVQKYTKLISSGMLSVAFTTNEESDYAGIQSIGARIHAETTVVVDVMPHNFLPTQHDLRLDGDPIVSYKMGKHHLHSSLREMVKDIPHQKYFLNPEPHFTLESEVIQRYGFTRAINLFVPITNYHHSRYGVFKKSLNAGWESLNAIITKVCK